MFVMNLNIQQSHLVNFTSNHQNMSELFVPQTTFHLFYITVDVISKVNIYYIYIFAIKGRKNDIYIFAIKGRKDDFRSMFKGKTCSFLTDKFYFCLLYLYFKLNVSFTFSYIVLNLVKFSLAFILNVDFTVSCSLLNFTMFFFNYTISKSEFCVQFFCVFCVVLTSHSSLLQSACCLFFFLSKRRAFHYTCHVHSDYCSFFCPNVLHFSALTIISVLLLLSFVQT
jgi:hypothetical protein